MKITLYILNINDIVWNNANVIRYVHRIIPITTMNYAEEQSNKVGRNCENASYIRLSCLLKRNRFFFKLTISWRYFLIFFLNKLIDEIIQKILINMHNTK